MISKRMSGVKASAARELLKVTSQKSIISFAGGNPSTDAFPVNDIKEISQELFEENPFDILQYGVTEGEKELLDIIHEKMCDDINENDSIIISTGSQQIIDLLSKVLCDDGDLVIVEEPTFIGAILALKANGCVVEGVHFKDGQIDLEELEILFQKHPKFFYTIPNFQNPTGYTMSLEVRQKVVKLAKQYNVMILEDDPYKELRFHEEALPTLKSLSDNVVYGYSFSKILAPGLRIACAIGPELIISKMVIAKQGADVHTNRWAQKVTARYLKRDSYDRHLQEIRHLYHEKCQLMYQTMTKSFSSKCHYDMPEGGMFIWVTMSDTDIDRFVAKALEKGVAVVPGKAFMIDGVSIPSIRLNYSSSSEEEIIKGIKILGKLTKEEF